MFLLLLFIIEKMEITLMSSTKGMGNKLWNISLMEYITQTLKTNILQNGKVFTKSLKGLKKKFTMMKVKAGKGVR